MGSYWLNTTLFALDVIYLKMRKILSILLFFVIANNPIQGRSHFYGELDYLFWNISQVNMPYSVSIEDLNNFANFEEIRQQDHWASGFRIRVATNCLCDFDAQFSWTRFHNQFHDSESNKILIATELLAPSIGFVIGGAEVGGPASSKWNLKFDIFDLDFGKYICFHVTIHHPQ